VANRRFAQRSRKRVTSWHGGGVDIANIVTGTIQFQTIVSEATMETFPTPTIVRIRGSLSLLTDDSSTPGAFGFVNVGLIVVTAAALAASGVPAPLTDIGNDWIWWECFTFGASAADVIGEEITIDRKIVDSKAMRKVGLNEVLVLVAELNNSESVMVANLQGALRVLLKAP